MVRHTILKIHMIAHILLSMLKKYATLMLQFVTVQKQMLLWYMIAITLQGH